MKCRECKAAMREATAEPARGTAGEVTTNLIDMPYMVCPQCGSTAFLHGEFPAEMLEHLSNHIPYATSKGFRTKEWSCNRCGARIEGAGPIVETFPVALSTEGRAFRAELVLSAVRCGACGQAQVMANKRQLESDMADSLIEAFKALGPINRW